MPEPRFRPCRQNQPMLLPPDVSELIPANSMARLVDAIVGRMDRRLLESLYPGGGAPAHDPSMMLKVETWARSIPPRRVGAPGLLLPAEPPQVIYAIMRDRRPYVPAYPVG